MLRQYVGSELEKYGNSGSRRMLSNRERTPRKLANTQSSNKNKGSRGSGDKSNVLCGNNKEAHIKMCDLCAQWDPNNKGSHWASECNRFNKGGSHKESARPYGGADGDCGKHPYNNSLSKDLDKQTKKLKKLKNKYKRQKKHRKRERGYNSSNNSS